MKKVTIILTASYFMFACNDTSKKEIQEAKQMAIDSMSMQAQLKEAKQAVIDSMTLQANIEKTKQQAIDSIKKANVVHHTPLNATNSLGYKSSNSVNATTTETNENVPTTVVHTKKKKSKKISTVAEGAIIGAGVGALTGAVISRNNKPGKGALIGGVIGAGLGAGTGIVINNQQKKKASQNQ